MPMIVNNLSVEVGAVLVYFIMLYDIYASAKSEGSDGRETQKRLFHICSR